MAQQAAEGGFNYPYDVRVVLEPWREKLGAEAFDAAALRLADRDRALEDFLSTTTPQFDQVDTEESTTSTTDTDLATVGPTCVVRLPRGRCLVHAGAYVTSTVTNQTAVVSLFIDGVFRADVVNLGNNTGGSIAASLSASFMFNDLTPGTHTFQLKYLSSDGNTVRFDARFLLVDPVA